MTQPGDSESSVRPDGLELAANYISGPRWQGLYSNLGVVIYIPKHDVTPNVYFTMAVISDCGMGPVMLDSSRSVASDLSGSRYISERLELC